MENLAFTPAKAAAIAGVTVEELGELAKAGGIPEKVYTFGDVLILRTIAPLNAPEDTIKAIVAHLKEREANRKPLYEMPRSAFLVIDETRVLEVEAKHLADTLERRPLSLVINLVEIEREVRRGIYSP